jgi:hypothetical protein
MVPEARFDHGGKMQREGDRALIVPIVVAAVLAVNHKRPVGHRPRQHSAPRRRPDLLGASII